MIYSIHVETCSAAAGREISAHPVRFKWKAEATAAALDALKTSRPHSRAKGTTIVVRLFRGKVPELIWEGRRSWLSYSIAGLRERNRLGAANALLSLREILRKSREADQLPPPERVAFDQILRAEISRGERASRTAAKRAQTARGDDR